ncbi:MAG: glutamate racemase [Lachnospiraceae bacterium]|jgi:glutamate racemase
MSDEKCRRDLPVGFFDSGLGGLSVLKSALKILPSEDYYYVGDSAHAPYGSRPAGEIRELTFSCVEKMRERGIKALVIACNTATAAAVTQVRERYPEMPVIGIEPALKPAVERSRGGQIIVMATLMTLRQQKFRNLLDQYAGRAWVTPVPCEGLMEFVEEGNLNGAELDSYFHRHLDPVATDRLESIVLGCTHYPFLKGHLRRYFSGRNIDLIDGSDGTVRELRRRLEETGLLRETGRKGTVEIENTAGEKMIARSRKLLSLPTD